ncbi:MULTISPECIES: hypothetical protein [unclassified Peribacillus]
MEHALELLNTHSYKEVYEKTDISKRGTANILTKTYAKTIFGT